MAPRRKLLPKDTRNQWTRRNSPPIRRKRRLPNRRVLRRRRNPRRVLHEKKSVRLIEHPPLLTCLPPMRKNLRKVAPPLSERLVNQPRMKRQIHPKSWKAKLIHSITYRRLYQKFQSRPRRNDLDLCPSWFTCSTPRIPSWSKVKNHSPLLFVLQRPK